MRSIDEKKKLNFKTKGWLLVIFVGMLATSFVSFAYISKSEIDIQLVKAEELKYKGDVLQKAQLSAYNAVAELTVLFQSETRTEAISITHDKFLNLLINYEKISEIYPEKTNDFKGFMRSLADSVNQPSPQKIQKLATELSTFQSKLDKQLKSVLAERETIVEGYTEALKELLYHSVLMAVIGVIVLAILVTVFLRSLTDDIKTLNFLLGRVLRSGGKPLDIRLNRNDELQRLAEKISELSERLRKREESILLIQKQRSKLEHNKATEHLIRGLVHAIGNPVTGLKGLIQQMIENNLSKEDEKYYLATMNEAATRLLEINQDLKSLSERSGKQRELLELNFILSEQLKLMVYDDNWFGIKTEFIPLKRLPAFMCSKDDLVIVIENLLENSLEALSHSNKSEKKLTIETVARDSGSAGFIVTDNGNGMPVDVKRQAFDAFYTTKPDSGQGDGMGLLMCLNLVEKYGGKLSLESKEGVGTSVTVLYPVIRENEYHENLEDSFDQKLSERKNAVTKQLGTKDEQP